MARIVAGLLCSTLLFVVLGEAAARWLGIIDILNGTPRRLYERTDIPEMPYRLRPNTTLDLQKHQVNINSLGLRGPEPPAKHRRMRQFLVLGDSVVFGASVSDEQTLANQLNRLAEAREWEANFLNAGVPGYNTESEAAAYDMLGEQIAPDEIILGVSLNDFGTTPVLNAFGVMTQRRDKDPPTWLQEKSELYLLFRWGLKAARGEHWFQATNTADNEETRKQFHALNAMVEHRHRKFYAAPEDNAWQRIKRSLTRLRDQAARDGVPFTVVIFPESFQFDDPPFRLPQRNWLDLCAELGIDAIDLWPAFAASESPIEELFFDTQHPNAAGIEVAAAAIADHLLTRDASAQPQ